MGESKDPYDRQKLAIDKHAADNAFELNEEHALFYDGGVSGTVPLALRPAWKRLLDYYQSRSIYIVIFEDCTRFARDLVVQEHCFAELIANG